jgi:hypothetical protein
MARTALTVNSVNVTTGVIITAGTGTAGTADGHEVAWSRDLFLIVENTSGAVTGDVTFVAANNTTAGGIPYTNETNTLATSQTRIFGPFELAPFVATDGLVDINFEAAIEANFKVIALKCTPAP